MASAGGNVAGLFYVLLFLNASVIVKNIIKERVSYFHLFSSKSHPNFSLLGYSGNVPLAYAD